jgi:hypothetical protein
MTEELKEPTEDISQVPKEDQVQQAKMTKAFIDRRELIYNDLKVRLKNQSKKNLIRAIADLSLRNDILQVHLEKYQTNEKESSNE